MDKLILICNAHIDPAWLWQWEEAAAETLSTFQIAADFCEEFDGFVFNHNDALLYQWIEEYAPETFQRIKQLVMKGKWHVMGGWYLQPDCNMPMGESIVRQIEFGQRYFKEKFGVTSSVATNFDSFGHSRGLVQILKKFGIDSYIHCRPEAKHFSLPSSTYLWRGYDGSSILCHRAFESYSSQFGMAAKKIEAYIEAESKTQVGVLLWGIGNHGGGPSRKDLLDIEGLIEKYKDSLEIFHGTPEEYFAQIAQKSSSLPVFSDELNPWAPGCYATQISIKQEHRRLENAYYMAEKMCAICSLSGFFSYPQSALQEALECLLFCEFHDILPGTGIPAVQEHAMRRLGRGIDIVEKLQAKAFFALCASQKRAAQDEIPILVFNPHPYPVQGSLDCEFVLPVQNWSDQLSIAEVYQNDSLVPSQMEKEESNLNLDWRKKVVFFATLPAMSVSRFICHIHFRDAQAFKIGPLAGNNFQFDNGRLQVNLNLKTGRIENLFFDGIQYVGHNAFAYKVIQDSADSWGSGVRSFAKVLDEFQLASPGECALITGCKEAFCAPVRIVEDGQVRTVVEMIHTYGNSFIVTNIKLPKLGSMIEVETRVLWQEKDKLLKLSVPVALPDISFAAQSMFGQEDYDNKGYRLSDDELLAQRYILANNEHHAMSVLLSELASYGFSHHDAELRITLLRSPAFSALKINDRELLPDRRFVPRVDQGEFKFKFAFEFGERKEIEQSIARKAQVFNERPYVLPIFPTGGMDQYCSSFKCTLSDETIVLVALKKLEAGNAYMIRLHNPLEEIVQTVVSIDDPDIRLHLTFGSFEVKTLRFDQTLLTLTECSMIDQEV